MDVWEIIGTLLGAAVAGLLAYGARVILPTVQDWLEEKIGRENAQAVERAVVALVKSADQLYKAEDPDGSVHNRYVKAELQKLNIAISGHVNALIEAAVLDLKG